MAGPLEFDYYWLDRGAIQLMRTDRINRAIRFFWAVFLVGVLFVLVRFDWPDDGHIL